MKNALSSCITLLLVTSPLPAVQTKIDPKAISEKMQWFADAKLGIFIHAGIYSVQGVDESWSFYNKKISHAGYMKQLQGFTQQYSLAAWADLIKESGARYAVITTKHHDGVAMYDTKMNDLSSVKATPAKRDMIGPFFEALRKRDIKCGVLLADRLVAPGLPRVYERQFPVFRHQRLCALEPLPDLFPGADPGDRQPVEAGPLVVRRRLGTQRRALEAEKVRHLVLSGNPYAIINGRLQGYGDYATPEQNFPVSRPKYPWWSFA